MKAKPRQEPTSRPANFEAVFPKLRESRAYHTYRKAFTDITGLPLALEPGQGIRENGDISSEPEPNAFCTLLGEGTASSCAQCGQSKLRRYLKRPGPGSACSLPCSAGLQHMAAPIRFGDRAVGFLVSGQFLHATPSNAERSRLIPRWTELGLSPESGKDGARAFARSRVIPPEEHHEFLTLLATYADRLSGLINPVLLDLGADAHEAIGLAVSLIDLHAPGEASLDEVVARSEVPAETFECLFKHAAGIWFGDYLDRHRLERARRALIAHTPASPLEAAPLAGCDSEFEFRRLFEDYLGETPDAYERRMRENDRLLRSWPDRTPQYPLARRARVTLPERPETKAAKPRPSAGAVVG